MPKIDRSKIPFDNNRSYPKEFAPVIAGREKQKLGDAVGLTQFGVNVSRIKANSKSALRHWHESEDEFIYMLEGELVLHEDAGETVLKPGDAAGWRANGGIGHCLINRTDKRRALSRSRHPLEGRARALSRRRFPHGARRQGPALDAQVRRTDQGVERRCRGREAMADNFKLDVDADGIALITWDMPGRSMNVIDLAVIEELSKIVEKIAADAAIKGAVITSGKETFCAGADLTLLETLTRTFKRARQEPRARRPRPRCCSPRAASCRSSTGASRPAASRSPRPSTAPRSAAASSSASPAISASPPTTTRPALGLPEVKIGLFPGAGGTQRIARMMPPADALQFLLKGDQLRLNRAKAMKLVDAVVPAGRSHQGRQGLGQGQSARPRRRGTSMASACRAGWSIPRPA